MTSIMNLIVLITAIIAVDAGLILPTGNVMTAEEFDGVINRMFDLNRKVQDARAGTTQVLGDVIERADKGNEPQTKRVGAAPSTTKFFIPKEKVAASSTVPTPAQVRVTPSKDPPKPEKPDDDLTGVPVDLLRICATISNQMYTAKERTDFNLTSPNDKSVTANAIIFDNHGALKDVIPPFCVAVAGSYLIMAWRGSSTTMDWVTDFGAAPVSSSRWNKVSSVVRAHSGYTSLVESELASYEGLLLKEISSRKIDTVLFTGHSLAGGMAQVAHLMLEGQLQTSGSPWNQLKKPLKVQSVSFAAPMTTLMSTTATSPIDNPTRNLLTKIAKHSCNLVYGPDIVPHGPGDIKYAVDVAEVTIPSAIGSLPFHWILRMFGMQQRANNALDKLSLSALANTLFQYQHIARVIYYPAGESTPLTLRDCQFLPESLPTFRNNTKVQLPTTNGKNHISLTEQLEFAHFFPLRSFAFNLDPVKTSKADSKM